MKRQLMPFARAGVVALALTSLATAAWANDPQRDHGGDPRANPNIPVVQGNGAHSSSGVGGGEGGQGGSGSVTTHVQGEGTPSPGAGVDGRGRLQPSYNTGAR